MELRQECILKNYVEKNKKHSEPKKKKSIKMKKIKIEMILKNT